MIAKSGDEGDGVEMEMEVNRMMSSFRKALGATLMVVSILGVLLSLSGVYFVVRYRTMLIGHADRFVGTLVSNLEMAEVSLAVTLDSLSHVESILGTAENSTQQLEDTLQDMDALFTSMAMVVGHDLPGVVRATQDTLSTAQTSAKAVDDILYALDSVSFLTGVHYDPDVSLADSIEGVSESMRNLSPSFNTLEEEILLTSDNVDQIGGEVGELAGALERMAGNLENAQDALARYLRLIKGLIADLERVQESIPRRVNIASAGVAFFLFWLGIIQVGLFFQGWEMFQGDV